MTKLTLLFFLFIGFQSFAEDGNHLEIAEYRVDSVVTNTGISKGKSKVIVRVINPNFREGNEFLYGYDKESLTATLNEEKTFDFTLNEGKYKFQFFSSLGGFEEITTGAIKVKSQTTTYISVNFSYAKRPEQLHVRKPVIYLYPTEETDVSIAVNPVGKLSFTYPEYNGKWDCTATPSGEIRIGESSYNYLFWEAEQKVNQEKLRETPSTIVSKENLVAFLENSLDQFGFNSKEKMDFITFWGPQMIQYEATEIRFILNEECAQFADLEITPKPTNLLRFYIVWNQTESRNTTSEIPLNISKANRNGFTVLEWGGLEITTSSNLSLLETED